MESLAWLPFLLTWLLMSPLLVLGAVSAEAVGPIMALEQTTWGPPRPLQPWGQELMELIRAAQKGFLCSNASLQCRSISSPTSLD